MRSFTLVLVVLSAAAWLAAEAGAAAPTVVVERATDPRSFDAGAGRRAPKSVYFIFGESPDDQDSETGEGGDAGSGTGGEGTGEASNGLPDFDRIVGIDLSGDSTFSRVSGFNAGSLEDPDLEISGSAGLARATNQALSFTVTPDQPGFATAPGYGNNWDQWVVWSRPAPNPGLPMNVRVRFVLNHDLEPGRDVFRLEVWKSPGGYETVAELTGKNAGTAIVDETVGLVPADYASPNGPVVRLRLRVITDRTGSDEDGLWPSDGAAQIDLIRVWFNGNLVSLADFETPGAGNDGWTPQQSSRAGDFLKLLRLLEDPDPCRRNVTYQFTFIDDGTPTDGGSGVSTGGSTSTKWDYGPGGWVVNYIGGISTDGATPLHNALRSPPFAWDVPGTTLDDASNGGLLLFSVWKHLPLENGIFYFWRVRSHAGTQGWSPWRDFGEVYYEPSAPHYERVEVDVSTLLVSDPDSVQFELGVIDLADAMGLPGNDATPSPTFDNLGFAKYETGGPVIRIADGDLFQSAFPTSGTADYATDLSLHSIRVDAARDLVDGPGIVPGDSMVVRVRSTIPGVGLAAAPRLRWALRTNPRYDAVRQLPPGAALETTVPSGCLADAPLEVWTGEVVGQPVVTSTGQTVEDHWSFDLPDGPTRADWHGAEPALFFPGDVLRWFVEARDAVDNRSTFPPDTTDFYRMGPASTGLDEGNRIHGLPSLAEPVAGLSQPAILVVDDTGGLDRGAVIERALGQIGRLPGCGYDLYRVRGAGSGLSNGIGASAGHGANAPQLAGYEAILYFAGDQGAYLLSNGSGDPLDDDGNDIGVLLNWRQQTGPRHAAHFGDNLVGGLIAASGGGALYAGQVMGVEFVGDDVRDLVDGQLAPEVEPQAVAFATPWIAGACLDTDQFDAIEPASGTPAVRTHEFVDPNGSSGAYAVAAAVWHARTRPEGPRIDVTVPVSFSSILDAGLGRTGGVPARAILLHEILEAFAVGEVGIATDGPASAARPATLHPAFPNPFNPRTNVAFDLPEPLGVQLRVLDLAGRHVRTLVDGIRSAGSHRVVWDGFDDRGSSVASGVYLVELRAAGVRKQQKVALIR